METPSVASPSALSYLKLFLALSRATHALLDIAAPCLAALLALQAFPSLSIIALGIGTALAGYLAVYALNDVVDYRLDRKKLSRPGLKSADYDLDAIYVRHPMAQGLLSFKEGILWTILWGFLALLGAYLLNPMCALIFVISILLESMYCLLLQVTYLRTIVSGMVKTMGAIAAVFAVDPSPAPPFLIILFLWLFFWEIGGQNIPNDWADVDEDTKLNSRTVPVTFGPCRASVIILASLIAAVIMNLALGMFMPLQRGVVFMTGALATGIYLLLMPALHLLKTQAREQAGALFNRSSYYPLTILVIITVIILFWGA